LEGRPTEDTLSSIGLTQRMEEPTPLVGLQKQISRRATAHSPRSLPPLSAAPTSPLACRTPPSLACSTPPPEDNHRSRPCNRLQGEVCLRPRQRPKVDTARARRSSPAKLALDTPLPVLLGLSNSSSSASHPTLEACHRLSKWFYDTSTCTATRAARCGFLFGKGFDLLVVS
jgi:hypothetical protein